MSDGRVIFPIQRIVVENGKDFVRTLNEGDVVPCYYCGKPIIIKRENVYIQQDDDMEMVRCSSDGCRKGVSVLYYFDRVIKSKDPIKVSWHRKNRRETEYG